MGTYKYRIKLTPTEKKHNLQREIYHQFRGNGAMNPEYYDDRYSLEEMIQIFLETIREDRSGEKVSTKQREGNKR